MPRPRKPVSEKRKNQTYSWAREQGKDNPTSQTLEKPLPPPPDFDKCAKDIFLRLQTLLIELGVLYPVDVLQLEMGARAYSQYVACNEAIIKKWKTIPAYLMECSSAKVPATLYTVMERQLAVYRHITERFGMSPRDRTAVTVPPREKRNKMEEFMDETEEEEKDLGV